MFPLRADGVPASDLARLLGVNERTVFRRRVRCGFDQQACPDSRATRGSLATTIAVAGGLG